jgi:predicted RNA-binding Zn ribbon-like protein
VTSTETPITAQELPEPAVCLDFANSVSGTREHPREELFSYADLLAWCRSAGVVTDAEASRLAEVAAAAPVAAAAVFARAIALREAIYRVFSAVAAGRPVATADLALVNAELASAQAALQLVARPDGFAWVWPVAPAATPLDRPVWPLARAAADLLTSGHLDRVRECDGVTCAWLFVDHSRNRSRRWCDMADCGNRAKAHRHRQRQRAATA